MSNLINSKSEISLELPESKPPTPKVLLLSLKGSKFKHEDLMTFQRCKKDSTKSFSNGILSGSVKIDPKISHSNNDERNASVPTEDTVKVDT